MYKRQGYIDYFNREGKNVKKSILKTPLDGARLSSTFGMRKHPISGFNKMHKGIDFAAPKGTPVYAGGNGVIERAGRNGGYGNYIRIRHNNEYKTAYAHLSGFKKGISKGVRVNQGEVIGYVGSTGRSTGPHLHYEIIYQNKQINPPAFLHVFYGIRNRNFFIESICYSCPTGFLDRQHQKPN